MLDERPMSHGLSPGKRSRQLSSAPCLKRQTFGCKRPRLSLDCTVPHRPLPKELTSHLLGCTSTAPSPHNVTAYSELSPKGNAHISLSADRHREKHHTDTRVCWPADHRPYSANAAFMMSCRTNENSASVYSIYSSAQDSAQCYIFQRSACVKPPSPISRLIAQILAAQNAFRETIESTSKLLHIDRAGPWR